MIRYFTRTILQFQFAAKLCDISGHTGPLHRYHFTKTKIISKNTELYLGAISLDQKKLGQLWQGCLA